MAVVSLDNQTSRTRFFHSGVLVNIEYWLEQLDQMTDSDFVRLDDERPNIVKAIWLAFHLEKMIWPQTCQLILTFSAYMERRGHWDIWAEILQRAITLAEQLAEDEAIVSLTALLARVRFQQSRFSEGIAAYRRTIRLARRSEDRFNEARACSNLGYHYAEKGRWLRAEILCCHALQLFEALDSDHGRAHTENHLGVLYTRQGNWNQAETYLKQALLIWQEMADQHGLMRGYLNMGMLFNEQEKCDQAKYVLKKAICQAKLVGEEATLGTIYSNLGNTYRLLGQFAKAEIHFWQAQTIFKQFSDTVGLALVQDNLGMIYTQQQKWPEAELSLQQALQTWRRLGNKHNEVRVLTYLIEYEMAKGNPRQANGWLREAENYLEQSGSIAFSQNLYAKVEGLRHNLTLT